eukprot:6488749-Amphidinium_carterae.2
MMSEDAWMCHAVDLRKSSKGVQHKSCCPSSPLLTSSVPLQVMAANFRLTHAGPRMRMRSAEENASSDKQGHLNSLSRESPL